MRDTQHLTELRTVMYHSVCMDNTAVFAEEGRVTVLQAAKRLPRLVCKVTNEGLSLRDTL